MPAKFHEQDVKAGLKNRRMLSRFLDKLVRGHLHTVKKVHLDYVFCDDDFLLQLNKQYLNHDTLTDIITFNLSENRDALAGEIYISVERVVENALKYGVAYEDELLRVIFHGALHLCGFKDKNSKDKKVMREHENKCLENYKKEITT